MSEVKSVIFYLPYVEGMSLEKDVSVVTSNKGDNGKSEIKNHQSKYNVHYLVWYVICK